MPDARTYTDHLARHAEGTPDALWLRDRAGDRFTDWSWSQAQGEVHAVAAWLEERFGKGVKMAILSRNRAHWVLADLAITASGNVAIPIFTTLPAKTARYVLEFSDTRLLFLAEAANWEAVREVLPVGTRVVCFPGVEVEDEHLDWDDLLAEARNARPRHVCRSDELISLVFTSGTTGVPKGVIQTHDSMLVPVDRFQLAFQVRPDPRFFSYLPLSHIAERQLVAANSLVRHGSVHFNESLETLLRDLPEVRPNFFFGPPRVWEQLQQALLGRFGGQPALDAALAEDAVAVASRVDALLGLGDSDYNLAAAAPTPPALIEWFAKLGIPLLEGFGQTEAMGLIANTSDAFRVGSVGRPIEGVEIALSEEEELLVRAEGLSPGYYEMPEKTAELYRDGWLHTGDKARIDEEGFVFLTGRVKDYFKTIQGKYVAPVPIENRFAETGLFAQTCLLGRGYSKTVLVGVLAEGTRGADRPGIEQTLRDKVKEVNGSVEKHARVGVVVLTPEPWTIENEVLTPTLKIRRERVEGLFGERAEALAREAAEQGRVRVEWL